MFDKQNYNAILDFNYVSPKDNKLLDTQTCWNRQTWRVCCSWFLHVKSKLRINFAYLVFIIFGSGRQMTKLLCSIQSKLLIYPESISARRRSSWFRMCRQLWARHCSRQRISWRLAKKQNTDSKWTGVTSILLRV